MEKNVKILTYKGRPLVRSGDQIYYGNMGAPFVVVLNIRSKATSSGLEIAQRVTFQLVKTDPTAGIKDRIVKSSEKIGLYCALDVASAWLEKALEAG